MTDNFLNIHTPGAFGGHHKDYMSRVKRPAATSQAFTKAADAEAQAAPSSHAKNPYKLWQGDHRGQRMGGLTEKELAAVIARNEEFKRQNPDLLLRERRDSAREALPDRRLTL